MESLDYLDSFPVIDPLSHIPAQYSRLESVQRAYYISDVTYDYFLALKKGDAYLGRALISFVLADKYPEVGEEGKYAEVLIRL